MVVSPTVLCIKLDFDVGAVVGNDVYNYNCRNIESGDSYNNQSRAVEGCRWRGNGQVTLSQELPMVTHCKIAVSQVDGLKMVLISVFARWWAYRTLQC